MKHLKLFKNTNQYESHKNGSDYILPHVSYVEDTKVVNYGAKKSFVLRAKYNATPDNLVAFTKASNIKSLNVNGTPIEFEPIKTEITTFDVLGENISMNTETGESSFPESYLIKSPVSSWSFKAKDPNYVINENTYFCALFAMDGMVMVQPDTFDNAMNYMFTTNDGITLEVNDTFLGEMNMQIQSGLHIGFTLANVDINSGNFIFIDTEHQINLVTGGISTYSFDSEGSYDVKIELTDSNLTNIEFTETSLTSIEIGNNITLIGTHAFSYCTNLTSVTIGDSVTMIGDHAFYGCNSLTSVTIGDSVKTIGKEAFYLCSSLTSVNIPDSVTTIRYDAFAFCSKLTSVNIPNSVTIIERGAFQHCDGLTSIIVPNSITTIEDSTFSECSNLTSVTIPNSVTSIGGFAFSNCDNLTSITCHATTAPNIHSYTFHGIQNDGILYVPTGSDYSSWMSTDNHYLGKFNWTIQYI